MTSLQPGDALSGAFEHGKVHEKSETPGVPSCWDGSISLMI